MRSGGKERTGSPKSTPEGAPTSQFDRVRDGAPAFKTEKPFASG